MSIECPEAVVQAVAKAAAKAGVTLERYVSTVLLTSASEVLQGDYLDARARRSTGAGWDLLDSALDCHPRAGD